MTRVANEAEFVHGRSPALIDVLMYHSISTGPGPTCIHPEIFAQQMAALAEAGCHVMSLSQLATLRSGKGTLPGKITIITFDDAYVDFAENAAPLLLERGWTATVFAPTGWVGRRSGWVGAGGEALMDWKDIRSLFASGIEFGSHSVSHSDLTTLSGDNLRSELTDSQSRLEQELGAPVRTFAAPYGAASAQVRTEIARFYDVAVGTRLARVEWKEDIHDIPRIEMHYFRDIDRWRQYLAGKAEAYFALRQLARSVRSAIPY
jgi:peptidoglycan/xylan/chitin deacetylase (PgdA/CDA1 family)